MHCSFLSVFLNLLLTKVIFMMGSGKFPVLSVLQKAELFLFTGLEKLKGRCNMFFLCLWVNILNNIISNWAPCHFKVRNIVTPISYMCMFSSLFFPPAVLFLSFFQSQQKMGICLIEHKWDYLPLRLSLNEGQKYFNTLPPESVNDFFKISQSYPIHVKNQTTWHLLTVKFLAYTEICLLIQTERLIAYNLLSINMYFYWIVK